MKLLERRSVYGSHSVIIHYINVFSIILVLFVSLMEEEHLMKGVSVK